MTPEEAAYRPSTDPTQSCAACQHMGPDGMCAELQILVEPEMVCDLFMPKGDTMSMNGRVALEDKMFGGGLPNG